MSANVKADSKNRLTMREAVVGSRYLVGPKARGSGSKPAPEPTRPRVVRSAKVLTAHLDALAAHGFSFTPVKKAKVPPCRF